LEEKAVVMLKILHLKIPKHLPKLSRQEI